MRNLPLEKIQGLSHQPSIDGLNMEEIYALFKEDSLLQLNKPDALCQIDPRDGALIVYNSNRAKRPSGIDDQPTANPADDEPCPICDGRSTAILDVAELSEGFTFINKNLFPILFPVEPVPSPCKISSLYPDPEHKGRLSYGLHFLQWTSSIHEHDWQNMPLNDCVIVLQRLGQLEKLLLTKHPPLMPRSEPTYDNGEGLFGYVSIIKNFGKAAGGSLAHGHQQIGYSNVMPRGLFNNLQFLKRHQQTFSQYLLNENPPELLVKDYPTVRIVVPYFMKRPYDLLVLLKDTSKRYLFELSKEEEIHVAQAWRETARAYIQLLPSLGKEAAYNVTVHNGPGAGLYVEFLPYTQLLGGFERLGLWVCQENPIKAAEILQTLY